MTPSPNMQRAALWYAQRLGWHVFPCHTPLFDQNGRCIGCTCEQYRQSAECQRNHPHLFLAPGEQCANPGKCPRVRWGKKSTVDPDQVAKWWGYWPTANVGIDCGKSNLLVFDADTYKNHAGDLGDLLTWEDRQTVTSITGGGGEHLLYNRQGKPYGNATGDLPAGIDIRGAGGYIVAPPSLHKSGRRYQFEAGYAPHEINLAAIPDALDTLLSQVTHNYADCGEPDEPAIKRAALTVRRVLDTASLTTFGMENYGAGVRWVLQHCPFNPESDPHAEDRSAFVIVRPGGRISAGCHHNRCQQRIKTAESGWQLLRKVTGQERRRVMVRVQL